MEDAAILFPPFAAGRITAETCTSRHAVDSVSTCAGIRRSRIRSDLTLEETRRPSFVICCKDLPSSRAGRIVVLSQENEADVPGYQLQAAAMQLEDR